MIRIGPEVCRDIRAASSREWLCTNGLGGFASGTIAGINTRRYHGVLVATLDPPAQRMVLVAAIEEWLRIPGEEPRPLSAQEYWDGTLFPDGFRSLDSVAIEGMVPCFKWTVAGRTVEKRIWMEPGINRTVIAYRLRSGAPVRLQLRPLFAHRDYHDQRHGQGAFTLLEREDGWAVEAAGVRSVVQMRPSPVITSRPDWYWRVLHRAERDRGLDDEEDLFTPGIAEVPLSEGDVVVLTAGTDPIAQEWDQANPLVTDGAQPPVAPVVGDRAFTLVAALTVAASQFRVARGTSQPESGGAQRSLIAGYHWFLDWGRDTMISLPGLTLTTGAVPDARLILSTYLAHLDHGLLPNRFPDAGGAAEYNSMDATLWLFQALDAYLGVTGDWSLLAQWLSSIEAVIDWHVRGTRHNIKVDPHDGLLAGGDEGVALTWMDARVADWVVTPRHGKPVEINALWFNALQLTADWCARLGRPSERYRQMAMQARASAATRFWNEDGGCLFDVVDAPGGDDASLRPNQVLALALVYPLIEGERARRTFEQVTTHLLTPYGLRTLNREDPRYQPAYQGDQRSRDAAYHMGMVWPWLLGPYLDARRRLGIADPPVVEVLQAFVPHLAEAGLNTISEIFEPEPPYRPVGCIAQAWSVAEVLRHAALAAAVAP